MSLKQECAFLCLGFFYICRFMKRIKHSGLVIGTFAAVFLFSLPLSISTKACKQQLGYSFIKRVNVPMEWGDQLPFQKKDNEKDQLQDDFSLACHPVKSLMFMTEELQYHFYFSTLPQIYMGSDILLYLIKQLFIIRGS